MWIPHCIQFLCVGCQKEWIQEGEAAFCPYCGVKCDNPLDVHRDEDCATFEVIRWTAQEEAIKAEKEENLDGL